jgi:hypothetical protein
MDIQNTNNTHQALEVTTSESSTVSHNIATHRAQVSSRHSMFGLYSLISGLCTAVFAIALPNLPFIVHASSNTLFYITYSILAAACLLSLLGISIPSFKKTSYPNISGLIGLILNLFVLYSSISVLIIFIASGNN